MFSLNFNIVKQFPNNCNQAKILVANGPSYPRHFTKKKKIFIHFKDLRFIKRNTKHPGVFFFSQVCEFE